MKMLVTMDFIGCQDKFNPLLFLQLPALLIFYNRKILENGCTSLSFHSQKEKRGSKSS
jgi:hypothetical protein